ncbi:MAG: hypothetical protein M1826_000719 [Phylliscum demangeonii]|nr:MAG: hypothetical protein M1826_000719 [Phylliscum demangeonii]
MVRHGIVKDAVAPSMSPRPTSPARTIYRLDEGYSEGTRSQAGSDTVSRSPSQGEQMPRVSAELVIPAWISALPEVERRGRYSRGLSQSTASRRVPAARKILLTSIFNGIEFGYMILRTLRTSSIANIVDRLHPRLHLDPIAHLPPELTYQIFSYLTPSALLMASTISQAWRARTLDSRLWRRLYLDEGWVTDAAEVRRVEKMLSLTTGARLDAERKARMTRGASDAAEQEQRTKKRILESGLSLGRGADDAWGWKQQHGAVEADDAAPLTASRPSLPTAPSEDEQMGDADAEPSPVASQTTLSLSQSFHDTTLDARWPATAPGHGSATAPRAASRARVDPALAAPPDSLHPRSTLTLTMPTGERRLNWQHLYKQRRRLEENWSAGRFTNFQLPHPDHPEEGHRECIYTIQYSGRYLVSGSRDRSIRIWDLDTKRLVRGPLTGHAGSVLCLQFDADEEEDNIISGSSDAHVIIWKFSTGALVKRIRQAHRDPVLNLRYDKRFLVTCSKDKTINVWSRRALEATSEEFPLAAIGYPGGNAVLPIHVLTMAHHYALMGQGRLTPNVRLEPLPPYSLIMSLRGHNAAVNAIQVLGDQVVSASGDRTIKVWNLRLGTCDLTINGHSKGIACVQYDGRRIVSGSSDNTVKIFDRRGAEVACLMGHQYLVRTVQAGFGDVPGGEEDDQVEARAVDEQYYAAVNDGLIPLEEARARRPPNAGSKAPRDIAALGAALPPGGGGSRWGRIVSGSYDETIIIWKRDAQGNWVIGQRLKQEEAARAASGAAPRPPGPGLNHPVGAQQMLANMMSGPHGALTAHLHEQIASATALADATGHLPPGSPEPVIEAFQQHLANISRGHMQQLHQVLADHTPLAVPFPPHLTPPTPAPPPQHPLPTTPNPLAGAATAVPGAVPAAAAPPAAAPATSAATTGSAGQGHVLTGSGNARVFKLQFDARRIICCSQDPRIVGWDFANDDEDIMEASRFFKGL